jgi:hypothetical protein
MRWDDVSELRPTTGLLFISRVIYERGELWWNDADREIPKNSERNQFQYHFALTYPICNDPGANPDLQGERPATNRLSVASVM